MTETEKNKLWEEYSRRRTAEVREKLIIEYAPLVKIVAGRLSLYLLLELWVYPIEITFK